MSNSDNSCALCMKFGAIDFAIDKAPTITELTKGIISSRLYPIAPNEATAAIIPLYHLAQDRRLSVYFCRPSIFALACFSSSHILFLSYHSTICF